ncbi:DUF3093 domain-containing protein [Nocardioides marmorisolisilvae]|uniref:DUF3093 domain-containing protein n=1 Tax=Nocardioides marmorisolisilvae TaxID=1542737 RepID=A0A3N0DVF5_9ACTN|nr:DUF3093 domain-containing protein [Nocardioides marmorisolisilvae]RNL79602.1 DUF3093 domain-containing protein [Nocardioides marmorisolisilvae]
MPTTYLEQLRVPLRWWVQSTMFLATVWLAFIVSIPEWIAWTGTGVLVALTFGLLAWIGSSRIEVRDGVLHAGPAHIDVTLLGAVEPLDKEATRLVHGRDADVRAFLHTRPYISRAVKIAIADPADPTPYWLVSTRHPRKLAAALTALDNAR